MTPRPNVPIPPKGIAIFAGAEGDGERTEK